MINKIEEFIDRVLRAIAFWCIRHAKGFTAMSFDLKQWDVQADGERVLMVRRYRSQTRLEAKLESSDMFYVMKHAKRG